MTSQLLNQFINRMYQPINEPEQYTEEIQPVGNMQQRRCFVDHTQHCLVETVVAVAKTLIWFFQVSKLAQLQTHFFAWYNVDQEITHICF
jgi:hypothetical protein